MTEPLVKKIALSDVVKTEVSVDMNNVVSFFISKYENSLLDNKKQLSVKITELTSYLNTEFAAEVEKDVNLESFNVKVKVLGLTTKASLKIDQRQLSDRMEVQIAIVSTPRDSSCNLQMWKTVKVSEDLCKKFIQTIAEIDDLRKSLQETLEKLSNVSRKERELKGALAEKTLREAGVGDLFDDPTLLNLVSLPQLAMKEVK